MMRSTRFQIYGTNAHTEIMKRLFCVGFDPITNKQELPLRDCIWLCTSHLYPLLPHLQGWAGIVTFTFQSPCTSFARWGQYDGDNPTLSPTLHYRKSHWGKCPNVITLTLPRHCGDNQKVLVLHHSLAIPRLSP